MSDPPISFLTADAVYYIQKPLTLVRPFLRFLDIARFYEIAAVIIGLSPASMNIPSLNLGVNSLYL